MNSRPLHCERSALPTELQPRFVGFVPLNTVFADYGTMITRLSSIRQLRCFWTTLPLVPRRELLGLGGDSQDHHQTRLTILGVLRVSLLVLDQLFQFVQSLARALEVTDQHFVRGVLSPVDRLRG